MRVGMGYDVHRLVEDRKLIIGGVEIPYEKGLLGHSDADVLLHAIMDALLGAAVFDFVSKALSLCVSWLFMRENPALMLMVVPFVVIGYFGSLGGLFSGVRAVRELRHAGIIRE